MPRWAIFFRTSTQTLSFPRTSFSRNSKWTSRPWPVRPKARAAAFRTCDEKNGILIQIQVLQYIPQQAKQTCRINPSIRFHFFKTKTYDHWWSGQSDCNKTVDSGSISGRSNQRQQKLVFTLSCLTFTNQRDSVKPPLCVVDRWAGGSLTRRPKSPFAVS